MNRNTGNILIAAVLVCASVFAMILQPTHRIADDGPVVKFETVIPEQFGAWHEIKSQVTQIVNPQQKEILDRIYSETISRSYVSDDGYVVMLSIAYGVEQSDSNRLHYPEVCYPAQGFQIMSKENGVVTTRFGEIKAKKLFAQAGPRNEPVTYWTVLGDKIVRGGTELKFEQIRYGLKGEIPDGSLVRISSIDPDKESAFKRHEDFIMALLEATGPQGLKRLIGQLAKH